MNMVANGHLEDLGRVFLVDGDNTSPAQVACLVTPMDIVLVADNGQASAERWNDLFGTVTEARLLVVERQPQAADMSLAFAAGELVARRPKMRNAPWIICSRDHDFQALASCLVQYGVKHCVQVAIQPTKVCTKPTPAKALPSTKNTPKLSKSKATQRVPVGQWLHNILKENGGYPFPITNVNPLVKSRLKERPDAEESLLKKGKMTKKLTTLGFVCKTNNVVAYQAY